MYEIKESNFEKSYEKICESLKRAKFISFDSEFSGINRISDTKVSLFDTAEERYDKLKNSIKNCIAIQYGLTTFEYDREKNKYNAEIFNFYLFPKVSPGRDVAFEFHASAIEFLCSHDFDFNKFTYGGISYLSEEEEMELRCKVADNSISQYVQEAISFLDEDKLKLSHTRVSDWIKNSNVGETMSLESGSPTLEYLVQKELRNRFPQIWTKSWDRKIILQRVDKELRKILEHKEQDDLENTLINSYIGFSKIFKLIVDLKKPIIGHNVFLDLMFMHQQFYKPLPKKYIDFKNTIHRFFPTIYDTKHISFEFKKILKKEEMWKSNGLSDLYDFFKIGKGKDLALNAPIIAFDEGKGKGNGKFHEAGWDSYCSGYCFIRMAHIFAVSRNGGSTDLRPLTNLEILAGVKEFANCVNLIRASVGHLNFGGPDPACQRPQLLHVKSLGSNKLNISQIAEMFSSYGTVDVKPFRKHQALVAVGNHGCARDILKRFRSNRDIHVAPYSLLRHSPAIQILLWSGVLISGSALVWIMHKHVFKRV